MLSWRERERARYVALWDTDVNVDADGVVRWKSNNSVPPQDVLQVWKETGKPFNMENCKAVRSAELQKLFSSYKTAQAQRTPEEVSEQRAQARAAMGPGVNMVNVITGERFRT